MEKLYQWLKKDYLQQKTVIQMRELYNQENDSNQKQVIKQLQLQQFFNTKIKTVVKQLFCLDATRKYVPNIYNYSFAQKIRNVQKIDDKSDGNKELMNFLALFQSEEWIKYISFITGIKVVNCTLKIKSFGHKDYSLIHDSIEQKKAIIVLVDITPNWKDEFGGYFVLHKGEEFFVVPSAENSILIYERDQEMKSFVKYVNHHAGKKKKIFLEIEYEFST